MKQNVPLSEVMSELAAPDAGQTLEQVKTSYHTAVRVQVPRDLAVIQANVLAEMEMTGEDAYYYWTVAQKNKETGKIERVPITGPSIDGAMILVRNWGNCAVEIDVCQEDRQSWTFKAVFVDLQTGFTSPRLFRQRKSESHGKYDEDRKLDIAFQIGQSKAIRNTITKVMPAGLMRVAMEKAHEAAASKYKDLQKWVPAFIRKFSKRGVTVAQLETKLEKLQAEWTAMDLATLEAIGRSIKDGETTVDDEFGDLVQLTDTTTAQSPAGTNASSAQPAAAAAQQQAAPTGPPSKDVPIDDLVKQAMAGVQQPANESKPNDLPASWGGGATPPPPATPTEMTSAAGSPTPGPGVKSAPVAPAVQTPPAPVPETKPESSFAKTCCPKCGMLQHNEPDGSQKCPVGHVSRNGVLIAGTPAPVQATPTVGSSTPETGSQPAAAQPTAPAATEQPVQPALFAAAPGEEPDWAKPIMAAANVRAMNTAVMAAVKGGIPKAQIDPYSSKRRSELNGGSK